MRTKTLKQDFIVPNEIGLHARPAALLANAASQFDADIKVKCGNGTANGKSIIDIMNLYAGQGSIVTVTAIGEDAEVAIDAITCLFRSFASFESRPMVKRIRQARRDLVAVG